MEVGHGPTVTLGFVLRTRRRRSEGALGRVETLGDPALEPGRVPRDIYIYDSRKGICTCISLHVRYSSTIRSVVYIVSENR